MTKNYKNTMILPKTNFAMRANLPENEPKRLQWWDDIDIYGKVLEKNKDGEPFVLHDGPPYANGPIHIGHAFNKILKDFVIKSHAQRGYLTPYIPGWDCHGQPIEHMIEKTLGTEKFNETPQPEIRRLCREWAEKYIDVQREGFRRLGVNGDWEHPYLTFVPELEAGSIEVFKALYLKGDIYRGRKPIHWCKHCHTALAEAEIEYADEESPSIFVNFLAHSIPAPFAEAGVEGELYILIWTTTPWTLPANSGVSLAPDADYAVVRANGVQMLFARDMAESVAQAAGWDAWDFVRDAAGGVVCVKGKELLGLEYTCPIRQDRTGKVVFGDHVTLDAGTGCVHTAPGHGQDDYLMGEKFGLAMYMPVDDDGRLTEEAAPFAGLDVDEANPKIIDWLREQDTLVAEQKIEHSYPHCWRCKQPVIFRATSQWFVSMDEHGLREAALDEIRNKVEWVPAWAKNRIGAMVEDRPDWCISRQRSWGVPIPVYRCKKCGADVCTEETLDAVIDLFAREGADAWFTRDPHEYLPEDTCCPECGSTELEPEKDILDVWWESGSTHTSVCKKRPELHFPAEMYLEGSDQHRGWFQSSLLTSVGAYGCAPYKSVMHCGFTMDGQGRKMSKSLGNGIDPADVEAKFGADVLRLWVASVDYSQDVNISDEILKGVSDSYRKIRNTIRYLMGGLADFSDDARVRDWDALEPLDQWALVRLARLIREVEQGYDEYRFHNVFRAVYTFVDRDLSNIYLDVCKDRLYSEAPDSPRRRAAQTVLLDILDALVRMLSPILSFTMEEAWQEYPEALRDAPGRPISVQLAGWPSADGFACAIPGGEAGEAAQKAAADFEAIFEVRDVVTKALEDARDAGMLKKSQEAAVALGLPKATLDVCSRYGEQMLAELFIVASVSLEEAEELSASVFQTDQPKCPRCWNHRPLGGNARHADVCERCGDVLDAIGYADDGDAQD